MSAAESYRRFLACVKEDALLTELRSLEGNEAEIAARFSEELSFGTAGLRGIIGVGTSRMNVYTVSRATFGLWDVVSARVVDRVPVFVIGYDTRNMSDVFARRTAEVLASRGAQVYLAAEPIPVPFVSFATRALGADAGVCITASHNPAAYNGYKVFDSTGSQLLEDDAMAVSRAAAEHDYFEQVVCGKGEIAQIPQSVIDAYFAGLSSRFSKREEELTVVYTPLCGTGLRFVPRALSDAGFSAVHLVEAQARHDGNFPTCEKPNPEVRASLKLAEELAEKVGADVFLATDPDCDRVGVGVRVEGGYRLLTGNETGLLLMDHLLSEAKKAGRLTPSTFVCTTIVSAPMADALAASYGVTLCRTLTGFKYIGEQMGRLEREGREEDFLFGFEESYGCVASTAVRDKDACEACVLVCRLAAALKREGKTLADALKDLEARFGVYRNDLKNYEFTSREAEEASKRTLSSLRSGFPQTFAGFETTEVFDCLNLVKTTSDGKTEPILLPRADVLSFSSGERARVMMRPSGTEPKVKLYLFAHANTEEECDGILARLSEYSDSLFG
ncbi:MAG: phospho-sugar mutase [Clostridia bacterium]|nr:phospho-sugar mutase [Clostridia bacterium]